MTLSRSERGTAGLLLGVGAFQIALAAGAPWGRAAFGGAHHGRLPTRLRRVSAVACVGYAGAAALVLSEVGSPRTRAAGFTGLTALMCMGTLANGASRSPVERAIWTPVAGLTAALSWRARQDKIQDIVWL